MTTATFRYLVRSMTLDDIPRVAEIEQESFPTMWPQTAYRRELQHNKLAAYLVVSALPDPPHGTTPVPSAESRTIPHSRHVDSTHRSSAGLSAIVHSLRRLLRKEPTPDTIETPPSDELVVGFVGLWFMVNEAHIVTIAVAQAERRRGLGELLLIAAIELSQRREQEALTLECRVSNTPAQALYEKYGFERAGIRKRYYTDNNEDALIMTTPSIQSSEYRERFERLRAAHRSRHGIPEIKHPELQ